MKQKHKRKISEQLRQAENRIDSVKHRVMARFFSDLENKRHTPLFLNFRRPYAA